MKTVKRPKPVLVSDILPAIAMIEDLSLCQSGRVVSENIVGSAFAADNRGYFLTAKHVVKGLLARNIELRTAYKRRPGTGYGMLPFPVEAIYPHQKHDIAVLAVPALATEGRLNIPLKASDVPVGSDILLVGYATGTDLVFCDDILGKGSEKSLSPVAFNGMISARIPDDGRPLALYVYDCTTFGGNSGAPIISVEHETIIGLHLRGYENHVGYAIPAEECLKFIAIVAEIHEPRRQKRQMRGTSR